jgi:hypothetical protein
MPSEELTAEQKYAPKLPPQIQAQVDAVNAAYEAPPRDPDESPEDEPPPDGPPEDEPPEDEPAPYEPPQEPGYEPGPAAEDNWEQRARSTLGRLEQALTHNQQLARRVSELEHQITGLKVRGVDQPAAAPATPPPKPKLIKDEEVNDYGEEFFDVVGRRAREEFVPEIETMAQRLAKLEAQQQNVGKVISKNEQRTVYDRLYDEVPEWKQINHSDEFKQWLTYLDPYSGRQRYELLGEAFTRHDGNRVVNFFKGFLTEAAGLPSDSSSPGYSAPPLASGNGSGRPSLEDFAAPGRARSAPQQLPPDKPVYSRAQIAQLSREKQRGLWRGREAELEAIERDIFQAQHEGRITLDH